MRRFTITVPLVDNAGRPREDFAQFVEQRLRAAGFDGWTALEGNGVWRQSTEPVRVYVIDSGDDTLPEITRVAQEFRSYGEQDTVYVTSENVETFPVDTGPEIPLFVPTFEPEFARDVWSPELTLRADDTAEAGSEGDDL